MIATDKKNIAMALLAVLIGLIFLSSYFTLQNLSTGTPQAPATTKTAQPPTVYGLATANAVVSSYNNTFSVLASCKNSTVAVTTKVGGIISELEQNNSIYNSYTIGNETVVESGIMNTSAEYKFFGSQLNKTAFSCLVFSTDAAVTLPPTLVVYIINKTYTLSVPANLRSSEIPITLSANMTALVPVRVSTLVTNNGTIYSLNVTRTK